MGIMKGAHMDTWRWLCRVVVFVAVFLLLYNLLCLLAIYFRMASVSQIVRFTWAVLWVLVPIFVGLYALAIADILRRPCLADRRSHYIIGVRLFTPIWYILCIRLLRRRIDHDISGNL
jgi:hypothetical protein